MKHHSTNPIEFRRTGRALMRMAALAWLADRTYVPQFTTNLAIPFAPLTGYGGPITNGVELIITDLDATESEKFYRLRISLPQ